MDFEKRMTGFYMHSVCLPEKVTRHFTSFVGKFLEFKCHDRETWYVGLIKSGDRLVLQPGWSDFARANHVWQNDLVVFRFLRGTTFEVRIFDPVGYEVVGVTTRGNCTSAKTKRGEPNPGTRKRSSSQNQSSLPLKKRPRQSRGQSLSKEEGRSMRKKVHTTLPQQREEELVESEGENDFSLVEKLNEWEEEGIEICRRDYMLVCEHQALLRRKMQLIN